jgi:hypothetical protein
MEADIPHYVVIVGLCTCESVRSSASSDLLNISVRCNQALDETSPLRRQIVRLLGETGKAGSIGGTITGFINAAMFPTRVAAGFRVIGIDAHLGPNITGDAANEPSIAVDPTDRKKNGHRELDGLKPSSFAGSRGSRSLAGSSRILGNSPVAATRSGDLKSPS